MKKSEILKMIREEVEVVLTNAEAVEVFDLDPAALLDEVLGEGVGGVTKENWFPGRIGGISSIHDRGRSLVRLCQQ